METQPAPEHVAAGAALRRMDEARANLSSAQMAAVHGRATQADVERAHDAYNVAVRAYYEEGGK